HIITANTSNAIAACPAGDKPPIGTNIITIKANIAKGIPIFFKFNLVSKPP
ncbi:hypothetical protein J2749_000001, partial [Methanobacterium oryzae]